MSVKRTATEDQAKEPHQGSSNITASIIIPNWNGKHHLDVCISALRSQTFDLFEIILVDNGSTDGSQALVKEMCPEISLIELGENMGFTGACNAGFKESRGQIIILLNNDTEVEADWLENIISAFERHRDAGIIASKIMMFEDRKIFHSAGDLYRVDGIPINRGVWQNDHGQYDVEEPVFSACGAAAAYRRSLIDEIGFLDQDFYFSCEDVDMGWRAQKAGWKVIYVPTAVVYHKLKATGGSVVGSYYDGRNFLYLLWKHYPRSLWRSNWQGVAKAQISIFWLALKHWRGKAARARIRGQFAGLLSIFRMVPRPTSEKHNQIGDDQLISLLSPVDDSISDK